VITASEAKQQVATLLAKEAEEKLKADAWTAIQLANQIELARETVLPRLFAVIESRIDISIRSKGVYVRIPIEPWMEIDLLRADLLRTITAFGYRITIESSDIIDIRWS
jgi:hypothetical protein